MHPETPAVVEAIMVALRGKPASAVLDGLASASASALCRAAEISGEEVGELWQDHCQAIADVIAAMKQGDAPAGGDKPVCAACGGEGTVTFNLSGGDEVVGRCPRCRGRDDA